MKCKISPSLMCADLFKLEKTLAIFEKNNVAYLHIDIMDGHFVPNFTFGADYCRAVKNMCNIPLDIHLMIENPELYLDSFPIGVNDIVSVHTESTRHLQKVLSSIHAKGAKTMVALNPATPIITIENVLDDIDGVLIMTVNPGFSGQKFVPATLKKISILRDYLDKNGYNRIEIEVDGNISFENAEKMAKAGANIFVAGTSSVFTNEANLELQLKKLRNTVNNTAKNLTN